MTPRNLTQDEIARLEARGCWAENWDTVKVSNSFKPEQVARACFSGAVQLGDVSGSVSGAGGAARPCGVYDSSLHNVTIGDGVRIAGVNNLANYDIGAGAVVENVGTLAVDGETCFGNGIEIEVFNEGGGRELKIFDRLSAQIAYLLVVYRHEEKMIERLQALVGAYCDSRKSTTGTVGAGARIENTITVVNVAVGPAATISGALELHEGTVGGCEEDPVTIGAGVVAREFIVLAGSKVEDAAVLGATFIGEGCRIGKQYSAENSAFFANSEGFHGEACSVFGGPYTVTHHKSSLLIAGLFSFYNAGSGTNQSNHMYKLGPIHQGVLMRGAKTGSFSYMLWPSVAGPFSVVVGKHMDNFDLGNLPFSYIDARDERTHVTPAMNLFTVGTRRDSAKWPSRDRRKVSKPLDLIHFDLFSPYIIGKCVHGSDDLRALYEKTPKEKNQVNYHGAQIGRLMLRTSCKYYDMAVRIFLGECLIELLEEAKTADKARERMAALADGANCEDWVDLCGLLAPQSEIAKLVAALTAGEFGDLDALGTRLEDLHAAYGESKLRWFAGYLSARTDIDPAAISREQIEKILDQWLDARGKLNNMILQDAKKEFAATSQIGFGIDGDQAVRQADFESVRGTFEGNKFTKELEKDTAEAATRLENLKKAL